MALREPLAAVTGWIVWRECNSIIIISCCGVAKHTSGQDSVGEPQHKHVAINIPVGKL